MPHRSARTAWRALPTAALLTLALTPLLATGCTAPAAPVDSPSPVAPAPTSPAQQGVAFDLYTHCGIDELMYEDRWYQRVGGPLGTSNPPAGWGNPTQPGRLVVDRDHATFTDDEGHEEVFEVREGATDWLMICA